ncbi:MAG TPA: aspartate ammonia-lyase [Syntrophomonadaceae bacterium]|nr:aspartate ammonia-lyase [Syntrophomonadaceae bacterium]
MRTEKDHLGEELLDDEAFYGLSTTRAQRLFNVSGYRWQRTFIKSLAIVKQAAIQSCWELGYMEEDKARALLQAAQILEEGALDDQIVVDPFQGGAGTATNLNINEVLANQALELMGLEKGRYDVIHPLDDVNRFQSTNDVIPTAARLAVIYALKDLEQAIEKMQEALQEKERQFARLVKSGRTQYQAAVPVSLGMEFGTWAEAIARDRWRVFKSVERIKVVNIGGTAVGTGITAPRKYIFRVIDHLRRFSRLGVARAENLVEATANNDVFSEVSGIMRAHAGNLMKIGNDLRFLSSDVCGEILLQPLIRGSSIMPGKVNPVMPELMVQCGMKVLGNDAIIAQAAAAGHLELNAFVPLIVYTLLESLEMLTHVDEKAVAYCIPSIMADEGRIHDNFMRSNALVTALLPVLGYSQAEVVWNYMQEHKLDIREANQALGFLPQEKLQDLLIPENLLKLGEAEI